MFHVQLSRDGTVLTAPRRFFPGPFESEAAALDACARHAQAARMDGAAPLEPSWYPERLDPAMVDGPHPTFQGEDGYFYELLPV